MTRRLGFWSLAAGLLLLWPAPAARAVEIPLRKAGLWEMRMVRSGSPLPDMTMQHCTDETTDKAMSAALSPVSRQACSSNDIRQTATGYVTDSVCSVAGLSMTSHSEISGDLNSAYTVKTTTHAEHGATGHDLSMTVAAKWLGACKPGQKPGDIVMPGGFKLNIRDAERLQGLLPK